MPPVDWRLYHTLAHKQLFPSVRQFAKAILTNPNTDPAVKKHGESLRKLLANNTTPPVIVDDPSWRSIHQAMARRWDTGSMPASRRPAAAAIRCWLTTQLFEEQGRASGNALRVRVWRKAWGPRGWAAPRELPSGHLRLPIERYFYQLGRQVHGLIHASTTTPDPYERPQAEFLWNSGTQNTTKRKHQALLDRYCRALPAAPDMRSHRGRSSRPRLPASQQPLYAMTTLPWLPPGQRSCGDDAQAVLVERNMEQPWVALWTGAQWDMAHAAAALHQRILGLLWWLHTPGTLPAVTWKIGTDLIRPKTDERRQRRNAVLAQHRQICVDASPTDHPLDGILDEPDESAWP